MRKKLSLLFIFIMIVSTLCMTGCQEVKRSLKDTKSQWTGLNRTATVYDQSGNIIKEYKGKFDIEVNEYGNKIKFDIKNKRVMIYNATVIVEETK